MADSFGQDVLKALGKDIGASKSQIKSRLVSVNANISEGITEQGYTFIMDEDHPTQLVGFSMTISSASDDCLYFAQPMGEKW